MREAAVERYLDVCTLATLALRGVHGVSRRLLAGRRGFGCKALAWNRHLVGRVGQGLGLLLTDVHLVVVCVGVQGLRLRDGVEALLVRVDLQDEQEALLELLERLTGLSASRLVLLHGLRQVDLSEDLPAWALRAWQAR